MWFGREVEIMFRVLCTLAAVGLMTLGFVLAAAGGWAVHHMHLVLK